MIVNKNTKIYVGEDNIERGYQGDQLIYGHEPIRYITDGLALLCDGYRNTYDGHATGTPVVWENLVNTNFNIQFATNTAWEIEDNGMRIQVPSNTLMRDSKFGAITDYSTIPDTWTVEEYMSVVSGGSNDAGIFSIYYNSGQDPFFGSMRFYNFFRSDIGTIQFGGYCGDFYTTSTSYTGKTVLITTVYDRGIFRIYANGQLLHTESRIFSSNYSRMCFGVERPDQFRTSYNTVYNVKYHSIRYYTKALTTEEVQHNYEIDKERFK